MYIFSKFLYFRPVELIHEMQEMQDFCNVEFSLEVTFLTVFVYEADCVVVFS